MTASLGHPRCPDTRDRRRCVLGTGHDGTHLHARPHTEGVDAVRGILVALLTVALLAGAGALAWWVL